jgi:hypothetical protein
MQDNARTRLLLADVTTLDDAEALEKLSVAFQDLMIGELRRALAHRIGIGSMIMACCAVDFLGTLLAGDNSTDTRFRAFVQKFLPAYDARRLRWTRDRLVHNYAVPRENGYGFSVASERAVEHLDGPRIVVDRLVDDIKIAGERLFELAATDGTIRTNILKRLRSPGIVLMEPADL